MTSSTGERSAKAALVAVPVALVILALGLWTFTRGGGEPGPAGRTVDPALADVAVQAGDLPGVPAVLVLGRHRDPHRSDGGGRPGDPPAAGGRLGTAAGPRGRAAVASYWGDSDRSCEGILDPDPVRGGGGGGHVATAFSVVVRFESEDAAVAAYFADIFQQSSLEGASEYEVATGTATGLGPRSVVGISTSGPVPVHQAVWQHGSMHVLYGSENLPPATSARVVDAIDGRIR